MMHSPFLKCLSALYFHTLDLVLGRKSESPKYVSQSQQTSKYKLVLSSSGCVVLLSEVSL